MSEKRDYYDVLGVAKSVSRDQIKQAYRKLARQFHPDIAKDVDKNTAEARFKEINEAYQILSEPSKREAYDQFGHAGAQANNAGFNTGGFAGGPFTYTYTSGNGNPSGFENFDPFDVFEEFFGFRGFGSQRGPRKGRNLKYEMYIDFVDAVKGAEKTINVESGKVKIKIPPGVFDGSQMRFPDKGLSTQGGASGDLYITFRIKMPKEFQRFNDNLGVLAEIDMIGAALGCDIVVPVVDVNSSNGIGKAKLKIPAGTQFGTQFRMRGKGMPVLGRKGFGDVIVQVSIIIPKKLSRKQREHLEQYLKQ